MLYTPDCLQSAVRPMEEPTRRIHPGGKTGKFGGWWFKQFGQGYAYVSLLAGAFPSWSSMANGAQCFPWSSQSRWGAFPEFFFFGGGGGGWGVTFNGGAVIGDT